jgi:nucleotide-binding universal stress UspA family protein
MRGKIIKIANVTYSKALLIQANLEAIGIYCFLSNVNQVQSNVGDGVGIMIHESQKDKALEIISTIQKQKGHDKMPMIKKMRMSRRILVPVDFSDHSVNACRWALELAHRLKAEIRLVHVYFNPATTIPNFSEHYSFHLNLDKFITDAVNSANYDLNRLVDSLHNTALQHRLNVKISKKVIGGLTVDSILEESKEFDPAFIIMGTKGKGEMESHLLGSVTRDLIEYTKVPVLAIPQNAVFRNVNDLHNIMYASNFDEADFNSLGRLVTLLKPFDINLHCIHIDDDKSSKWDEAKLAGLKSFVAALIGEEKTKFNMIINQDIIDGISLYARENEIDVISLTTKKRNFFTRRLKPSLAKHVVYNSSRPILIFHSN